MFWKKSNFVEFRFPVNINLGFLPGLTVGNDAQKVMTFDFCFTNVCICGVT